ARFDFLHILCVVSQLPAGGFAHTNHGNKRDESAEDRDLKLACLPARSVAAATFAFCVADPIGSADQSARIDRNKFSKRYQIRDHSCLIPVWKKFSRSKNFRELHIRFPGLDSGAQTSPKAGT